MVVRPIHSTREPGGRQSDIYWCSSAGPEGSVYSFRPGSPVDEIAVLEPKTGTPPSGAAFVLPGNVWDNGEFADQLNLDTLEFKTNPQMFADDVTTPRAAFYVSPDGSLVLPHGRVFRQGPDDVIAGMDRTGWRWSNNLDAYGFVTAPAGRHISVVSGAEHRTYRARCRRRRAGICSRSPTAAARASSPTARAMSTPTAIFVWPRGRRSAASTCRRPIQLLFGGADRRTLFILGHHTLYMIRTKVAGGS
jgi:hypothetical protein